MTTATESIVVFANPWDGAILDIIAETEKALHVVNRENKKQCWIPKSGIACRKPGVPSYENEYIVKDWFFNKLNLQQQKALNLAE